MCVTVEIFEKWGGFSRNQRSDSGFYLVRYFKNQSGMLKWDEDEVFGYHYCGKILAEGLFTTVWRTNFNHGSLMLWLGSKMFECLTKCSWHGATPIFWLLLLYCLTYVCRPDHSISLGHEVLRCTRKLTYAKLLK
jgi:hypothetical protein